MVQVGQGPVVLGEVEGLHSSLLFRSQSPRISQHSCAVHPVALQRGIAETAPEGLGRKVGVVGVHEVVEEEGGAPLQGPIQGLQGLGDQLLGGSGLSLEGSPEKADKSSQNPFPEEVLPPDSQEGDPRAVVVVEKALGEVELLGEIAVVGHEGHVQIAKPLQEER